MQIDKYSKKNRIMAAIVTYNPEMGRLMDNVNAIAGQVERVLIVDNASDNVLEICRLADGVQCDVVLLEENKGLGTALNLAMKHAWQNGFSYVCLLDQDSVACQGMVASLAKHFNYDVASVSPVIIDRNKADRTPNLQESIREIRRPITSGSLISYEAWRRVGGFDEDFFIDYIDYEFDERCLKANYRLLEDSSVFLLQEGGHAEKSWIISGITHLRDGRIVFKHPYSYGYSSIRLSIRYRNAIIFFRRYCSDSHFAIQELLHITKNIIHDLLVEKHHFKNMHAIVSGLNQGIRADERTRRGCE